MKNNQKIKIVMMLVVSICLAGCGKTDTEQQNAETSVSSSQTETQEQANDTEKSNADGTGLFTTEERQKIVLAGHEIEFPCRYSEFTKYFNTGFKIKFEEYPDIGFVEFEYNGEIAGTVILKGSPDVDYVEDTDWIFGLSVYDFDETGLSFEYCDINEGSTLDDVMKNFGEPTERNDPEYGSIHVYYYDDMKNETSKIYEYDCIAFIYETEDKMKEITLYYNINNLAEE